MRYYFWILGCAMNYSDAERMAAVLDTLGYTKTEVETEADLFIVIACSVRESAALSIYGKMRDLNQYRKTNPNFKTILTGCVLAKDQKKLGRVFDILIKTEDIQKLPSLLSPVISTGAEKSATEISRKSLDSARDDNFFSITPHYESTFRAYVPISTGCDNFCTYCAVPYTKGREVSRPIGEIVSEVKNLVQSGYKEITLLGQNVNSYGNDFVYSSSEVEKSQGDSSRLHSNNNAFMELLMKLDDIPGDHRIYFYSNHPKDMTDELIATLGKLVHFPHYIHLPLQSGNDEIIRAMNRHYTKQQYLDLVGKVRNVIPDVTLTTDIIVGFPGETEAQFADTVDVMEAAEYDMAFIAQYSPRSGTVSAKLPDNVTDAEKKRREKVLQAVVKRTVLEHNKLLVGTTQRVLVDEHKNGKYFGRTEGFKVVEIVFPRHSELVSESNKKKTLKQVQGDVLELGQFVEVTIESAESWKLVGTI